MSKLMTKEQWEEEKKNEAGGVFLLGVLIIIGTLIVAIYQILIASVSYVFNISRDIDSWYGQNHGHYELTYQGRNKKVFLQDLEYLDKREKIQTDFVRRTIWNTVLEDDSCAYLYQNRECYSTKELIETFKQKTNAKGNKK